MIRTFAALAVCLALMACAAEVVRQPAAFVAHPAPQPHWRLANDVAIRFDTGYGRSLAAGTAFVEIGSVREGRVFKPVDTTFTVEGRHHHEAFPVVQGDRLIGFYLPFERSFTPLSHPVTLTLQERKPS